MLKKISSFLFPLLIPTTVFAYTINGNLAVSGNTVLTGTLNVNGSQIVAGLSKAGEAINCGISVSGSTFSITAADGTALSSTNPCFVGIKSNTAGQIKVARFTSNVTFTFGSSSDTDGNLFGITDVNWSNAMPFFLGVIYNGTTPYFTISRVPLNVSGSASTDLCQKGDTDCDAETDTMIVTTGLTLSSWVNLPITQIGWFKMTYATSGSAWTASTSIQTGFNTEYESERFDFPTKQKGASTAVTTYFYLNGGTSAPVINTNFSFFKYSIKKNGDVHCDIQINVQTNGVGSVDTELSLPYGYRSISSSTNLSIGLDIIGHGYGRIDLNNQTGYQPIILGSWTDGNRNDFAYITGMASSGAGTLSDGVGVAKNTQWSNAVSNGINADLQYNTIQQ